VVKVRPGFNFSAKIPKAQKDTDDLTVFLQIWDLGTYTAERKTLVKGRPVHFRSSHIDVSRLPSDQVRESIGRVVKGLKATST